MGRPVVRLHPTRQQPEPQLTKTTTTRMPTKNVIVVSSPSLAANRTRRGGNDKNYSLWGGGSATVVSPDNTNGDVILAELECVPSVVKYKVNTENSARPRSNKRKAEEELLDPEEEEKRKMRRNRNRLAAARCRQKRLDQIETLQEEVAALKADKEELQYILAAHRNTCSLQVKAEPVTEEESPVYVEVQPKEETVKLQRPGSLSLPITVNSIEGVSIDTPSNGILSFNTLR